MMFGLGVAASFDSTNVTAVFVILYSPQYLQHQVTQRAILL